MNKPTNQQYGPARYSRSMRMEATMEQATTYILVILATLISCPTFNLQNIILQHPNTTDYLKCYNNYQHSTYINIIHNDTKKHNSTNKKLWPWESTISHIRIVIVSTYCMKIMRVDTISMCAVRERRSTAPS
jgi:predicted small integral membrane protein